MKLGKIILLTVALLSSGKACLAQKVKTVSVTEIQQLIAQPPTDILVLNFWATWCAPCVKEIPLIEKFAAENPETKVILVSLDFASKIEKVNSFINRRNIKSEVLLLDNVDYNSWIDLIDKSWQGTIPATLLIHKTTGKRKFVSAELSEGQLEALINEIK